MATLILTPLEHEPAAVEVQAPKLPKLPRDPVSPEQTQRILAEMVGVISAEREAAQAQIENLQKTDDERSRIDSGLAWYAGESAARSSLVDTWRVHDRQLEKLHTQLIQEGNRLKTSANSSTTLAVLGEIHKSQSEYKTLQVELKSSVEKHTKTLEEAGESYKRLNDTAWSAARGTLITVATIGGGAAIASTAGGVVVAGATVGLGLSAALSAGKQVLRFARGEASVGQAMSDGWNDLKSDALTVAMAAPTGFGAGLLRGLAGRMAATTSSRVAPLIASGVSATGMGAVSVAPQTGVQLFNEQNQIIEATNIGTAISDLNSVFQATVKEAPYTKEEYISWAVDSLKRHSIENPRQHAEAGFQLLNKGDSEIFEYAKNALGIQTPINRNGVDWSALAHEKKWDFGASVAGNLIGMKAGASSAAISNSGGNFLGQLGIGAAETGASIVSDGAMLLAGKGALTPEQQIDIVTRNIVGNVSGRIIGKASAAKRPAPDDPTNLPADSRNPPEDQAAANAASQDGSSAQQPDHVLPLDTGEGNSASDGWEFGGRNGGDSSQASDGGGSDGPLPRPGGGGGAGAQSATQQQAQPRSWRERLFGLSTTPVASLNPKEHVSGAINPDLSNQAATLNTTDFQRVRESTGNAFEPPKTTADSKAFLQRISLDRYPPGGAARPEWSASSAAQRPALQHSGMARVIQEVENMGGIVVIDKSLGKTNPDGTPSQSSGADFRIVPKHSPDQSTPEVLLLIAPTASFQDVCLKLAELKARKTASPAHHDQHHATTKKLQTEHPELFDSKLKSIHETDPNLAALLSAELKAGFPRHQAGALLAGRLQLQTLREQGSRETTRPYLETRERVIRDQLECLQTAGGATKEQQIKTLNTMLEANQAALEALSKQSRFAVLIPETLKKIPTVENDPLFNPLKIELTAAPFDARAIAHLPGESITYPTGERLDFSEQGPKKTTTHVLDGNLPLRFSVERSNSPTGGDRVVRIQSDTEPRYLNGRGHVQTNPTPGAIIKDLLHAHGVTPENTDSLVFSVVPEVRTRLHALAANGNEDGMVLSAPFATFARTLELDPKSETVRPSSSTKPLLEIIETEVQQRTAHLSGDEQTKAQKILREECYRVASELDINLGRKVPERFEVELDLREQSHSASGLDASLAANWRPLRIEGVPGDWEHMTTPRYQGGVLREQATTVHGSTADGTITTKFHAQTSARSPRIVSVEVGGAGLLWTEPSATGAAQQVEVVTPVVRKQLDLFRQDTSLQGEVGQVEVRLQLTPEDHIRSQALQQDYELQISGKPSKTPHAYEEVELPYRIAAEVGGGVRRMDAPELGSTRKFSEIVDGHIEEQIRHIVDPALKQAERAKLEQNYEALAAHYGLDIGTMRDAEYPETATYRLHTAADGKLVAPEVVKRPPPPPPKPEPTTTTKSYKVGPGGGLNANVETTYNPVKLEAESTVRIGSMVSRVSCKFDSDSGTLTIKEGHFNALHQERVPSSISGKNISLPTELILQQLQGLNIDPSSVKAVQLNMGVDPITLMDLEAAGRTLHAEAKTTNPKAKRPLWNDVFPAGAKARTEAISELVSELGFEGVKSEVRGSDNRMPLNKIIQGDITARTRHLGRTAQRRASDELRETFKAGLESRKLTGDEPMPKFFDITLERKVPDSATDAAKLAAEAADQKAAQEAAAAKLEADEAARLAAEATRLAAGKAAASGPATSSPISALVPIGVRRVGLKTVVPASAFQPAIALSNHGQIANSAIEQPYGIGTIETYSKPSTTRQPASLRIRLNTMGLEDVSIVGPGRPEQNAITAVVTEQLNRLNVPISSTPGSPTRVRVSLKLDTVNAIEYQRTLNKLYGTYYDDEDIVFALPATNSIIDALQAHGLEVTGIDQIQVNGERGLVNSILPESVVRTHPFTASPTEYQASIDSLTTSLLTRVRQMRDQDPQLPPIDGKGDDYLVPESLSFEIELGGPPKIDPPTAAPEPDEPAIAVPGTELDSKRERRLAQKARKEGRREAKRRKGMDKRADDDS